MQLLNRTAIVVRARNRYVEWANSVREDGPKFTIEEARTNPSVYLVWPEVGEGEETSDKELIDARASEIFEAELERWSDDPASWPENREAPAFRAWFDVEVIEAVADVDEDQPIGPMSEDEAVEAALEHCAWCGGPLEDEEVRLVPYEPDEDVDPETRAVPVSFDDEHMAIAVRADEFEVVTAGDTEDDEDEDDEDVIGDEDEGDEEDDEDEDYEDEGFVLACCSDKCQQELDAALTARASSGGNGGPA